MPVQVLPITMYNSEYNLHTRQQIAVNDNYICYALKQGHIRVLSTKSSHRALIKAHAPPVTDIKSVVHQDRALLCMYVVIVFAADWKSVLANLRTGL
jgi:enhancer of mRNA-decapping protein 4